MRALYQKKSRSKREKIFQDRVYKEVSRLVDALASSQEFQGVGAKRSSLKAEISEDIKEYIKNNKDYFFSLDHEPKLSTKELVEKISSQKNTA